MDLVGRIIVGSMHYTHSTYTRISKRTNDELCVRVCGQSFRKISFENRTERQRFSDAIYVITSCLIVFVWEGVGGEAACVC